MEKKKVQFFTKTMPSQQYIILEFKAVLEEIKKKHPKAVYDENDDVYFTPVRQGYGEDDYEGEIEVVAYRLETDKEYEYRLAQEAKYNEDRAKQMIESEKRRIQTEKALLKSLKAKYE